MNGNFVWRDAGRTVVFDADGVAAAPKLLAEHGMESFELLSSRRHLDGATALAEAAPIVHELPQMDPAVAVTEAAAGLLEKATAPNLVALGGGRTIDTTKAIAAITGARVAAIPTTMSGAEMTGIHRLPAGAEDRAKRLVRPNLVIADPAAMTSAPEPELRASSMNALAHGADSLYTPFANPVSRMTALRGAESIATALDQDPAERNRETSPSARSSAATRSTPPPSPSTMSSAKPWSASAAPPTPASTPRSSPAQCPSWPSGPRTAWSRLRRPSALSPPRSKLAYWS